MGLTALISLIILLLAGLILIRRSKRRDHPANRYRDYQTHSAEKQPRIRRNRYHKTARREPEIDDQSPEKLATMIEQVKEPSPATEKTAQPMETATDFSDDPDVVLGLKEAPTDNDREKPIPNEAQITLKPPPPPPPIITFFVMAETDKPFTGYELLQAILSVGARYGQHQIFHRHEQKTGHGPVLFSVASATKPGTFDLTKMGGFSTSGLSLFFCAGDVDDPIAVYELMLQTAGQLIEDLGGHVFDEQRQLLTPAKVVDQRRLLRDFLQGQKVPDLFEDM